MIAKTVQEQTIVEAGEVDKLRLARSIAKHRPAAQELVNSAIDTAVSAGRRIGAYCFEVMRLVAIPSETVGTFNACEHEWRVKHPGEDGKPATKLPEEARSYLVTKSAMLKQWEHAPYYLEVCREHAGLVAVRSGQDVAKLLPPEGFLEIDSDRYAGRAEKAVALWRADFRTGYAAEKIVKEAKATYAQKQGPSGSPATPQGMTTSGEGGQFPRVILDAMNDLIRAVNAAENILSTTEVAAFLSTCAKAIREKTDVMRPKADAPKAPAEKLADVLPDVSDESLHGAEDLTDEAAEKLDKDLAAQTAQG